MARLPRILLPEQPHHLVQRGNNRSAIFFHDDDYRFFLDCLKSASQRYPCRIHAYVLVPNHLHLLVSPDTQDGLARLMQSVGRRYVQFINRTYQRTGTLWEGRYRAALIDAEAYVLRCYRYIECNPLRAKMVQHPSAYRWSSYRHHAEEKQDALIQDHALYRALGKNKTDRCGAYRALCEQALDAEILQALWEATNTGWVLGSAGFKAAVEAALNRRVVPLPRGGKRTGAGRPKLQIK